jgi:hypothetical protein
VNWQEQLTQRIQRIVGERDAGKAGSESTKMLLALNRTGKHIYRGTVPKAEIQRRRAKNKVASASRKANR